MYLKDILRENFTVSGTSPVTGEKLVAEKLMVRVQCGNKKKVSITGSGGNLEEISDPTLINSDPVFAEPVESCVFDPHSSIS